MKTGDGGSGSREVGEEVARRGGVGKGSLVGQGQVSNRVGKLSWVDYLVGVKDEAILPLEGQGRGNRWRRRY